MDMIPRNDYGERCQFDAYCKLVLYHEAIDYLREMQRRRDRELSFSDLPQMEMDKLCIVDHYPSDRFTFSSHGYDLHIENELVADAFAGLSVQEQSIDMITGIYAHILDEDRKVNAQKFETAFYAKPDLRNVRPPEEPAKSEPATLDLESLVEQLQKSPELASALAALIAAQAPAK